MSASGDDRKWRTNYWCLLCKFTWRGLLCSKVRLLNCLKVLRSGGQNQKNKYYWGISDISKERNTGHSYICKDRLYALKKMRNFASGVFNKLYIFYLWKFQVFILNCFSDIRRTKSHLRNQISVDLGDRKLGQ